MKISPKRGGSLGRLFISFIFLTIFCSQSHFVFSQTVIRNYTASINVKNYSIIETPVSAGTEFLMAGTIFSTSVASPRTQPGNAIHFMRVDRVGQLQWGGTYSVSVRYDFPEYEDVRCVDIVSYTQSQTIIVIQARLVVDPHDFLVNKDVIVVLVVNNLDGTIVSTNELYYPTYDWSYDNLYATHAIYHEDNYDGNNYLYICGYDGIETQFPNYPEFIPHFGPAFYDKRILVLKYDLPSTTVVAARTWDYPWPMWVANEKGLVYDFDMAMRMVPIDDGSGDIYVTGSTNSDYVRTTSGPFPASVPSYGSATLSLRIEETHNQPGIAPLQTVAIRPFIEHATTSSDEPIPVYEHGYGSFEETPGSTGGGLFVFSNNFDPQSPGAGFGSWAESIRMTYVDKATLNFTIPPTTNQHRMAFPIIDYNWGTQVLRSPNGGNNAYLAGLQIGWDNGTCGVPIGGNAAPNVLNNTNPFLAELTPTWSGTSVAGTGTNFWTTYFTQNGTGPFNNLGGGLSFTLWPTEFVADNASNINNVVFTAPRWDASRASLNLKFTRTDQNGNLNATGVAVCDNSYQDCVIPNTYLPQITDGWFFEQHIEDEPLISVRTRLSELTLFAVGTPTCSLFSMYKPTDITTVNDGFGDAQYSIYPNPANDYVNVKIVGDINDESPVTITLYNIVMQSVGELYVGKANDLINGKELKVPESQPGMYIIRITSGDRLLHVEKLSID